MRFISDTAPITLHTDASDYDAVDGVEQLVAFVFVGL